MCRTIRGRVKIYSGGAARACLPRIFARPASGQGSMVAAPHGARTAWMRGCLPRAPPHRPARPDGDVAATRPVRPGPLRAVPRAGRFVESVEAVGRRRGPKPGRWGPFPRRCASRARHRAKGVRRAERPHGNDVARAVPPTVVRGLVSPAARVPVGRLGRTAGEDGRPQGTGRPKVLPPARFVPP